MGTAQAAGIALVLAARNQINVVMHTPSEVKAAVTGSGRANKAQVGKMVLNILKLDEAPKPSDSADALALAICHIWRGGGNTKIADALAKEKKRLALLKKTGSLKK
jgi:crossover junction endodeoxyribonuclease RuvC